MLLSNFSCRGCTHRLVNTRKPSVHANIQHPQLGRQPRPISHRVTAAGSDAIEPLDIDPIQSIGALGSTSVQYVSPSDTAPVQHLSVAESRKLVMEETKNFLESDLKKLFTDGVSALVIFTYVAVTPQAPMQPVISVWLNCLGIGQA